MDDWLNLKEAAQWLRVSEKTLRKMLSGKRPVVPSVRSGRNMKTQNPSPSDSLCTADTINSSTTDTVPVSGNENNLKRPVGRGDLVRLMHELPDVPTDFLASLCGFGRR